MPASIRDVPRSSLGQNIANVMRQTIIHNLPSNALLKDAESLFNVRTCWQGTWKDNTTYQQRHRHFEAHTLIVRIAKRQLHPPEAVSAAHTWVLQPLHQRPLSLNLRAPCRSVPSSSPTCTGTANMPPIRQGQEVSMSSPVMHQ